jgi:predicted dehydrogenase
MASETNRRDFLKASAAGPGLALGAGLAGEARAATDEPPPEAYRSPQGFAAPPLETVRMAFVGVGLQGGSHVQNFLRIEGVEILAICDIDEPRAKEVSQWVVDAGRPAPDLYTRGETDWKRLCERDDIDLVFNATPWEWHVPASVEAMKTGKHAAVEVPASYTIDGCWELVETAEKTSRHCVMMENCNYGRAEMMVLKMVRAGLFGELLHGEGAYIHDLRSIKLSDANEGLWRWDHSTRRNGNLYPTHGLGPIAQCMDINRGDQFDYLVSMSSPARGLNNYVKEHLADDDPRKHKDYILGDMNSALIKTKLGRTILVQHDTTSPRPYTRINLLQGTKGTFRGYPDRIFIEGETEGHGWQDAESWRGEWDHPLWSEQGKAAAGAGHGGMDFLEDYRLIQCLREGKPTDMDVYDAAAVSVVTELTELSVAQRSQSVDFPDFTRGLWKSRKPLGIVS